MPSILVETSYLTNARDERRLRDKGYLARIAEGIFLGIRRFALGARVAIAPGAAFRGSGRHATSTALGPASVEISRPLIEER